MKVDKYALRTQDKSIDDLYADKSSQSKIVVDRILTVRELNNKKILDVGSGLGHMLIYMRNKGLDAYGIEPEGEQYQFAIGKLKENAIDTDILRKESAEKMSYLSNYFDFILCSDVIEHVDNVEKALREMKRVLKIGGEIYLKAPDYLMCYEAHFKVPFPPSMPKFLSKKYFRLFGYSKQDCKFIEHINYVNYFSLRRIFKKLNFKVFDWQMQKIDRAKDSGASYKLRYYLYKFFRISWAGKLEFFLEKL